MPQYNASVWTSGKLLHSVQYKVIVIRLLQQRLPNMYLYSVHVAYLDAECKQGAYQIASLLLRHIHGLHLYLYSA